MPEDELLEACAAAPRFGVNAKAIILQAAAKEDDDDDSPVLPELDDPRQKEWECLARGAEFLDAVDPRQRPLLAYVPRSRLPRTTRQTVLSKLTGQHLALAALWQGQLEPATTAANEALRARAFCFATDQEADLFRRCAGVGVYQNKAAQLTALAWEPTLAARPVRAPAPVAQHSLPKTRPSSKRPRCLQEADIDWEAAVPEEDEAGGGLVAGRRSKVSMPASPPEPVPTPHTVLSEPGAKTLPMASEQAAREVLKGAMTMQLASLAASGWSLAEALEAEIVARCVAKILRGREAGDADAILRDEHSRVRSLVWKEVQACLTRTLRALDDVGAKPRVPTNTTRDAD